MQKLKNIEFLRVFLIICIVFLHMFIVRKWSLSVIYSDISLYQYLKNITYFAYNSVEGFFIIAGFFLVLTFKSSVSLISFIKKKYFRLTPVIIFTIILCVLESLLHIENFKYVSNVLAVFLLNNFIISWGSPNNSILWYTSALFSGLLFYFLILKHVSNKINSFLILIMAILSYCILIFLQQGSFVKPLNNYYFIFNVGFLRAMGGLGFGCYIGFLYKKYYQQILNIESNVFQKIFFTILEITSFLFVIWWLLFPHMKYNNIFFVVGFVVLFVLFLLKQGYISRFFDKDIWVKLGKYQYSIYVVHYLINKIYNLCLWKYCPSFVKAYPIIPIVVILLTVGLISVFTYHCIEKPCARYLTDKFL